jgi:hypothetical protein
MESVLLSAWCEVSKMRRCGMVDVLTALEEAMDISCGEDALVVVVVLMKSRAPY